MEELRKVKGFEDYALDREGNLFSLKFGKVHPMAHRYNSKGYDQPVLRKGGEGYKVLLSRLMLLTWKPIDNPEGFVVDHINGNPKDNRLENLRWVTFRRNLELGKKCPVPVKAWYKGEFLGVFSSNYEASKVLGINQGNIYYVLKGICHQTCGGYTFEYANKGEEE